MKELPDPLPVYLDSSALVKLVLPEPETASLLLTLREWPDRVTSEISVVEVIRAAQRASLRAEVRRRARSVMAALHLLRMEESILESASTLAPARLRTLDSIHLASALSLETVAGMIVYDSRLAQAARDSGLKVLAPA
jgi:predicted nucleic acid-binding protein